MMVMMILMMLMRKDLGKVPLPLHFRHDGSARAELAPLNDDSFQVPPSCSPQPPSSSGTDLSGLVEDGSRGEFAATGHSSFKHFRRVKVLISWGLLHRLLLNQPLTCYCQNSAMKHSSLIKQKRIKTQCTIK
jgi:hypothetical protein